MTDTVLHQVPRSVRVADESPQTLRRRRDRAVLRREWGRAVYFAARVIAGAAVLLIGVWDLAALTEWSRATLHASPTITATLLVTAELALGAMLIVGLLTRTTLAVLTAGALLSWIVGAAPSLNVTAPLTLIAATTLWLTHNANHYSLDRLLDRLLLRRPPLSWRAIIRRNRGVSISRR